MIIDGRGKDDSEPYEQVKALITQEGCLFPESIEVFVDRRVSAERINILASLAGYDTEILPREGFFTLKIDTSHRRCR